MDAINTSWPYQSRNEQNGGFLNVVHASQTAPTLQALGQQHLTTPFVHEFIILPLLHAQSTILCRRLLTMCRNSTIGTSPSSTIIRSTTVSTTTISDTRACQHNSGASAC
jgi:hypothetical protein